MHAFAHGAHLDCGEYLQKMRILNVGDLVLKPWYCTRRNNREMVLCWKIAIFGFNTLYINNYAIILEKIRILVLLKSTSKEVSYYLQHFD